MVPALMMGTAVPAFSARIGVDEAKSIAAEFLNSRKIRIMGNLSLEPVAETVKGSSNFYVFNVNGNKGFVIISAESSTAPVLGYSFEGGYPTKNAPDAMKWVMEGMEKEVKAAPSVQKSKSLSERKAMISASASRSDEQKLLPTAEWSQEGPFNNYIPGKPLVGCVGTAMATIMKFYEWPASGNGSFDGVDFNTNYNWSDMRTDNYRSGYSESEADAVATLMYHASKSIDTQYGMSGSSAYEVKVPAALSTYFNYDPGVSYKKRAEVASQEEWDNIVKNEIDEGRPVLYCGQDVTAGHAFICDGYQGEFLHFNWGWGGSANGYFLSTALNPTVSRTHHYNNLNTIIYNIKPGAEGAHGWSALHITADGNQTGIGSDMTDLSNGKPFTVRVGNLKNLSYSDFSGQIAVGLCGKDGKLKSLLSATKPISLQAFGYLFDGFVDFKDCKLPAGVSVAEGDKVCIVTLASGDNGNWLPVAGELPTLNELPTSVASPASFKIELPKGVAGVKVSGDDSVIRGWNYTFKVEADNADEDIVTVKANGYVLTADANSNYTISNVRENQTISILVQKAADVKAKRSVWVEEPGTLASIISEAESGTLKELTVFGSIDARDFEYIRNAMKLTRLDISGAYIAANGSSQANAIPREAFRGCGNLKEVILPKSVNRLNNGCFRQCGITTITIPEGVKTYEYNVFCGASALRDIYVGREKAEFINWCVLSGVKTDLVTLHVPSQAAVANYSKAENWNTISNIVVEKAPQSDDALFAVMDNDEVSFDCEIAPGKVARGTEAVFTAKHTADNDNRMEVYANNMLLTPDSEGNFRTTVDNNTIIHFNLVSPIETDKKNSYWTLTSDKGSAGLLTEAVNVIPGQEFTVRVNALKIPAGFEQFYWGIVLADANGDIKEFISPVNLWTAGAGDNWKMNVNCKVSSAKVREGNTIRLVNSANRKVWHLVKGADADVADALPALNNSNQIFNINIPEVAGVTVTGAVSTAIKGQDITLKISPNSSTKRIDLIANNEIVVKEAAVVNYTFVVNEDINFDIKVYDPKESGVMVYNVAPGELYKAVTEQSIRPNVVVTGETYASDLGNAFRQVFAQKTVKKLDLTGLKIVADPTNGDYKEDMIPSEMFYKSSGIGQTMPVVEEILLPNSVTRIGEAAFRNCERLKEIRLPESLSSNRVVVGQYASGSPKYGYSIGAAAFDGCVSLTTIYIPGDLATENGRLVVSHFNPMVTITDMVLDSPAYNLGHKVGDVYDASRITIVVPEKYLSVYKTPYSQMDYGNPWQKLGYNIVSEVPVFALNYDPTRCKITDPDFDVKKAAAFLGEDVKSETITVKGKLALAHPEIKSMVYDNGVKLTPDADGTYAVTFHNPAVNPEASGDHNIEVVYLLNVEFESTSPMFKVNSPEADGEVTLNQSNPLAPVIEGLAENSTVKFRVDLDGENSAELEKHVMNGLEELIPDNDGYYTVNVVDSNCKINLFATPVENAVLNNDQIAAINSEETADTENVALKGELTSETLAMVKECFPNAETLDLSKVEGDLPEGALAGMESITTVILPEVSQISKDMFNGCTNLTSVAIPASVNSIEEGAFKNCSSLESLTLTGVNYIGANAFEGCDNLTSITLLADGNASMNTRAGDEFDSHAFDGLNPNCVIVVDEGVEAPAAKANYLFVSKGMVTTTLADGSVAEIEGRVYKAFRPIVFTDTHALAIPHPFTLEDGATVSMEIEGGDWKGIVVPFNVETITDENGAELPLINGKVKTLDGCMAYTLNDNDDELTGAMEIVANKPYLFCSPEDGKIIFTATSGTVNVNPEMVSAKGSKFSINASYSAKEMKADEVYLLNNDNTAFEGVDADADTVEVAPFQLFASAPVEISLPENGHQSAIDNVEAVSSVKVAKEGNEWVIYAPAAKVENVYSIDGKMVKSIALSAGRNVIELEKGMYIICGTKMVF
ncbi:MAG: C10 family peptidase [Muribaculaceae bacterium]|nr:C10 family peptidase [Muribaculaceae bacterium]